MHSLLTHFHFLNITRQMKLLTWLQQVSMCFGWMQQFYVVVSRWTCILLLLVMQPSYILLWFISSNTNATSRHIINIKTLLQTSKMLMKNRKTTHILPFSHHNFWLTRQLWIIWTPQTDGSLSLSSLITISVQCTVDPQAAEFSRQAEYFQH